MINEKVIEEKYLKDAKLFIGGHYVDALSGETFDTINPATNEILASVAKYSIIALAIFMALDQLGVAATIVNSAFILILGGLALAFGLSFGLGGKEFASSYLIKLDRTIDQTNVDKSKTLCNPAGGNDSTNQSINNPERNTDKYF